MLEALGIISLCASFFFLGQAVAYARFKARLEKLQKAAEALIAAIQKGGA